MKDNTDNTLDGFIKNLFRTEKPVLSTQDFDKDNVWVCDLLNQDFDLANEFIIYKLNSFSSRLEKLQFLYSSRSCFTYTIEDMERELNPEFQKDYYYYRAQMTPEQMNERIQRYKQALSMTEKAICYYIDCSKLNCEDVESPFKLSSKKGAKIDVIRILAAFWELKLIVSQDGQIPTKQEFMETCGKLFGVDLSKYSTNLSQALKNQPLEVNLKVFEDLKTAIQREHYTNEK